MKKLFCAALSSLVLFTSVPCFASSMTEEEAHQAIHDMFANHTDEDLESLIKLANFELEYRKNAKAAVSEVIQDDDFTQKLICNYFEGIGLGIKYVMFQPLVEKDPGGLYGGEERWFVTLKSGEQIGTWVSDGKITYCYGNQWYNDVPLY